MRSFITCECGGTAYLKEGKYICEKCPKKWVPATKLMPGWGNEERECYIDEDVKQRQPKPISGRERE